MQKLCNRNPVDAEIVGSKVFSVSGIVLFRCPVSPSPHLKTYTDPVSEPYVF
jgi:hypothetical protein